MVAVSIWLLSAIYEVEAWAHAPGEITAHNREIQGSVQVFADLMILFDKFVQKRRKRVCILQEDAVRDDVYQWDEGR